MELTLFEECIQDLKSQVEILSKQESNSIMKLLLKDFPFVWANIEWEKIHKKKVILSEEPYLIIPTLSSWLSSIAVKQPVHIVWDDASVPVIKIDSLVLAVEHIDAITSVATRTWFFNHTLGYVLEWHWCGNKTIGLRNK